MAQKYTLLFASRAYLLQKLIMCIFEQLSDLNINFHKSEILCFGKAKEEENYYKQSFGCESGSQPFRYLGVPIHYGRLLNGEWKPIDVGMPVVYLQIGIQGPAH
jgi:hypothetical protein